MFQGYYTLGSAMISQNRNLNVISNNMANSSTPGYKADKYISSTFRDEMLYRSGNKTPNRKTAIGSVTAIQATNARVTNYEQGGYDITEGTLDFALNGNGFFVIQTNNGLVYTRDGSFITDEQGYLTLPGVGRVMGTNGLIQLTTDNIVVDTDGRIWSNDDAQTNFGTIRLDDFENYADMIKGDNGTFTAEGVAARQADATVNQGKLERSNISVMDEMTSMMSAQRSLQAAAQVIKIYDQLDAKTVQLGNT